VANPKQERQKPQFKVGLWFFVGGLPDKQAITGNIKEIIKTIEVVS